MTGTHVEGGSEESKKEGFRKDGIQSTGTGFGQRNFSYVQKTEMNEGTWKAMGKYFQVPQYQDMRRR